MSRARLPRQTQLDRRTRLVTLLLGVREDLAAMERLGFIARADALHGLSIEEVYLPRAVRVLPPAATGTDAVQDLADNAHSLNLALKRALGNLPRALEALTVRGWTAEALEAETWLRRQLDALGNVDAAESTPASQSLHAEAEVNRLLQQLRAELLAALPSATPLRQREIVEHLRRSGQYLADAARSPERTPRELGDPTPGHRDTA